jgi:hypothetical protein
VAKIWVPLSIEAAYSIYKIPFDIAINSNNRFFGLDREIQNPWFKIDGRLSLLVFLQSSTESIGLQFYSLSRELREIKDYNPLANSYDSFLSLNKKEWLGTLELLMEVGQSLARNDFQDEPFFEVIPAAKLLDFHLQPNLFPNIRREYYLYNQKKYTDEYMTIVSFTNNVDDPTWLSVRIGQLEKYSLSDSNLKNYFDKAICKIQLSYSALRALRSLIIEQLHFIE